MDKPTAFVPTERSSHKPPAVKLTDSARPRICLLANVHSKRPCGSAIAATNSPSSAICIICACSRSAAWRIKEFCQRCLTAYSSSAGAEPCWGLINWALRCHDDIMSSRTLVCMAGALPLTKRFHWLSSALRRCSKLLVLFIPTKRLLLRMCDVIQTGKKASQPFTNLSRFVMSI